MSETAAERALMAERHDDGDGRNATWHMSVNRMGSMLAAIRREAAEAAPPSGLDVERLRQAMARILDRTTFRRLEPYLPILAAEYAALRSPDTETAE